MDKARPLNQHVAQKVMAMASLMVAATASILVGLQLDGRDGLWELSGSHAAWIAQAAEHHGLRPRGINLQTGYDLNKEATWNRLQHLWQQHRPRKLWFSLPCQSWCPWTSLDKQEQRQARNLATQRRRDRRTLGLAVEFIKFVLSQDDTTEIYLEMPTNNHGWKQAALLHLREWLELRMIPWLGCRMDGCVYGLRAGDQGDLVLKKWTVMTTDEKFHQSYRAKVCHGNHNHSSANGIDYHTESCYPKRMVESWTRFWKDGLAPLRHHRLLSLQEDLPALCEDGPEESPTEIVEDLVIHATDDLVDHEFLLSESCRIQHEHQAREARAHGLYDWATCESLLLQLHDYAKSNRRIHSRGTTSGVNSFGLGAYSHGAFKGISKLTFKNQELTRYLNSFIRHHLPDQSWSSIMVTFNTMALPHQDHHNLKGTSSILTYLGNFDNGGLWLQGTPPGDQRVVKRMVPGIGYVNGYVKPTKNRFVVFDPRQRHGSQRWTGFRISVAAYTTRMAPWLGSREKRVLTEIGFPKNALDPRQPLPIHVASAQQTTEESNQPESPPLVASAQQTTEQSNQPESPPLVAFGSSDMFPAVESEVPPEGVSQAEYEAWQSKVSKFHRAAGHPTNRNLARIISDGGHPQWKVDVALRHKCPACEANRPGSTSAGSIPPASTSPMYKAWQAVTVDAAEWIVPGTRQKVKFLLFMDYATKLRMVAPIRTVEVMSMHAESAEDVIKAFSERWLSVFPKPQVVIMDAAKTFTSNQMHDFLSSVNILPHFIAEKEHWSHGVAEAAVQDVKSTATAIHLEARDQPPHVTLHLTAVAWNSTEYTAGFSAFQWAYGRNYNISEEDYRTFANEADHQQQDFSQLVAARQRAEEIARRTKAQRVLSKLANTTVRQPLRVFKEMDLVKIWRRVWPLEVHKGPRGGAKMSGRPHWIGPGRVVFHELLPQQREGDQRKHIVWVLLGARLYKCSVHSVRASDRDRAFHLRDLINKKTPANGKAWQTSCQDASTRILWTRNHVRMKLSYLIYHNFRMRLRFNLHQGESGRRLHFEQATTWIVQSVNGYRLKM